MSKQANQKYRKEKEKDHLNKAGIDITSPRNEKDRLHKDNIYLEYNASPSHEEK